MVKVRQVAQEQPKAEPEPDETNAWTPPIAEDWQPPFKPLPLCAWVPPEKRFKLPYVKVIDGKYEEQNCETVPCPCPEAKRHAIEKPDNIWRNA